MANKFKVGDRVKCIRGSKSGIGPVEGEKYTVISTTSVFPEYRVEVNCGNSDNNGVYWNESRFELAQATGEDFLKPFRRVRIANGCVYIVTTDVNGETNLVREYPSWLKAKGLTGGWEIVEVYEVPEHACQALDIRKLGPLVWKKEDPAKVAADEAVKAAELALKAAQAALEAVSAKRAALN